MTAVAKKLDPNVPTPPPGAKPIEQLKANRLSLPGFGWTTHEATVPGGTPLEHVLSSELWRRNAPKLKRGDHIRWRNDNLTLLGEIVVVASDIATGKIELRELWTRDLAPASLAETVSGGYSVRDLGVHENFAIVRDIDGHVVEKNIPSHDEANRRIRVGWIPNAAVQAVLDAKAGL